MYEIDFTRRASAGDATRRRASANAVDAAARRASRAFVPILAACAPPHSHGLRAFVFMKSRRVGQAPGYALKRGFALATKRCAERHAIRVALDEGDDDDDDDDDRDDGEVMWYQANLSIRAVPASSDWGGDD
jgi:hypothetical protein